MFGVDKIPTIVQRVLKSRVKSLLSFKLGKSSWATVQLRAGNKKIITGCKTGILLVS